MTKNTSIQFSSKHEDKRIERKLKELDKFVLFRHFTRTAKTKIVPKMATLQLVKGQRLFREGDKVAALYVVRQGELEVGKTIVVSTGTRSAAPLDLGTEGVSVTYGSMKVKSEAGMSSRQLC